jgi:hypothetical protein
MLGTGAACGGSNGTAATSSRLASPGPTAPASLAGPSKLDAEVPMPKGFPPDVPIYPGARLTAAGSFTSAGQPTTWGMEWETLDSVDNVQAFYSSKLSQGDWTVEFSGSTGAKFAANFKRKSNPKSTGGIGADGSSGVTKISMSLVS